MLPFALGAVVGAIAVTAIAESRVGKAFSKKGAKIIDTLEDRVSGLAKTVIEDHDLCEKLKSGYETVSSKVNELAEYCQEKGKDFANAAVKEKVSDQTAETKPAKRKVGRPAGAKNKVKEEDPEIASMVKKLKEAKGKEGEAKPKPKKRAFVLTPEEKRARKAKQARLYYAKNREKILAQNKERRAGKAKKIYPSRQKRIDKIKNIEIK